MQDDKREGAALVWSILSTLLNFALVYVGVGIKLAFNVEDANDLLTWREQNIFAVAATCSMTLITMIRMQHKGLQFKGGPSVRSRDRFLASRHPLLPSIR